MKLTLEHRKKLSEAHKGQVPTNLEQIRNYNLGRKFSEEHKAKIRASNKGKKHVWTSEGRIKFSLAKIGKPSWNNGLGRKITVTCLCGKTIQTNQKARKYCSISCYRENNRADKNYRWIADRSKIKVGDRTLNDPLQKQWRRAVKNRDKWKCRMAGIDCSGRLEAHHIRRWISHPKLRFEVSNGITLCHKHHPRTIREEERLAPIFLQIIAS